MENNNRPIKSITIVPRRDTLENWRKINPIPKDKELCVVYTKRNKCKYKIGDGIRPFNKLRYVSEISDLNEIICYAVIPLKENKEEYIRILSHIVLDPANTKYTTAAQDLDPYDEEITRSTDKVTKGHLENDPNESSEELPTLPIEK